MASLANFTVGWAKTFIERILLLPALVPEAGPHSHPADDTSLGPIRDGMHPGIMITLDSWYNQPAAKSQLNEEGQRIATILATAATQTNTLDVQKVVEAMLILTDIQWNHVGAAFTSVRMEGLFEMNPELISDIEARDGDDDDDDVLEMTNEEFDDKVAAQTAAVDANPKVIEAKRQAEFLKIVIRRFVQAMRGRVSRQDLDQMEELVSNKLNS